MRKINENETKYRKIVKKQEGITLIALVITIIVLLILASVTIGVISGDNGILKNAGKAKEDTEISEEKEIIEISVVQAMGNNSKGNLVKEEVEELINKQKAAKVSESGANFLVNILSSDRIYIIDSQGNVRKVEWWENSNEDGNKYITNGKVTLQIGDYITYDANDNGEYTYTSESEKTGVTGENQTFSTNFETKWRLLGIEYTNSEDYLVIIPDTPIKSMSSKGLTLYGQSGYQNGIEEIENICEIYGHGTGASYARAMKIEDINKITGYDPMNTGNGTVFRKDTINEYNTYVTVTKVQDRLLNLVCSNGIESTMNTPGYGYFNENAEWLNLQKIGDTVTLKNTYYTYYPTTLTDSSTGDIKGISTNSKEYSMLFYNNKNYWLASSYDLGGINTKEYIENAYGLFNIGYNSVRSCRDNYLIYSGGNPKKLEKDIMPIIYLEKEINLKETGNSINRCTEWELQIRKLK